MCSVLVLLGTALTGLALAGDGSSSSSVRPWGKGGWHASLTTPGEQHDAYGYDLGLSHRGRRGSLDIDLARQVYPQVESGDAAAIRIDAQSTARLAGGLLFDAKDGGFHHVEFRGDRMSWLDLEQSTASAAYDHRVARTLGLAARYGRASSPDLPVRTAVYLGAGLRRSLAVRSAHDGTMFDWIPSTEDKEHTASPGQSLFEQDASPQRPRLPELDFGRHRAEFQSGFSMSAQGRVDISLWTDLVDGRVDCSVELQELETSSLTVGSTISGGRTRYTAISSHTRLSARYVGWERALVPSLFVDLNSLSVMGTPTGPAVLPVYGFSLSRGGA